MKMNKVMESWTTFCHLLPASGFHMFSQFFQRLTVCAREPVPGLAAFEQLVDCEPEKFQLFRPVTRYNPLHLWIWVMAQVFQGGSPDFLLSAFHCANNVNPAFLSLASLSFTFASIPGAACQLGSTSNW